MRTKLFLSYSKGDSNWRDRFLNHLRAILLVGDELWVDVASLKEGYDWEQQLQAALTASRCALLLVTPNYLEVGRFARRELSMLAEQQAAGLTLLPVLVEPCLWSDNDTLRRLQFVRWTNSTMLVPTETGEREELRALSQAETPPNNEEAINRGIIDVCQRVGKTLGVGAQITGTQRNEFFTVANQALGRMGVTLEEEVHCGDFSVVYRGRLGGERVAVKAVPDIARQNRVRAVFDSGLDSLKNLRDPTFIRVHFSVTDREPHSVVMEYVDWPTLDEALAKHEGRRLPPTVVAGILAKIAGAQDDAHKHGVQIGPLSPANIHVNDSWEVRLSPIRLEGPLARAAGLMNGQFMNWEILTALTPEVYEGRQPTTRTELDAHEQYYLGMLGLELLIGRKPVEVTRFDELTLKTRFFSNPRQFFDEPAAGVARWTEGSPALAFLLAKLLARDPAARLPSALVACEELRAVADDELPRALRRHLETELGDVVNEDFAARFYERLFQARQSLRSKFSNPEAQSQMLARALQDLVDFRPYAIRSRFRDHVSQHARYGLTGEDIEAFRCSFVAQVAESSPHKLVSGDAWNAALTVGLRLLAKSISTASGAPAGAS